MFKKFYIILTLTVLIIVMLAGCESAAETTRETTSAVTTPTLPPVTTSSTPPPVTTTTTTTSTTTLPNYGGAIIPANEGQSPTEIWLDGYESRPNVLVVTKGTTVTWVNHDYWKPVTVVSNDGLFAANVEPTDGTFSYLFDVAGSFGYSIDPYSEVWQGVVIVTE